MSVKAWVKAPVENHRGETVGTRDVKVDVLSWVWSESRGLLAVVNLDGKVRAVLAGEVRVRD